jgi:DNA-binding winged helix-turn-helix (wHTH) protein/TolB-like protein/Flp pilus assembly protein TadD
MSQKSGHLYEFGPFVLDINRHVLLRDGKPVALTPKTYDTLVTLVENSGRMLSKSELMKQLWPDVSVEESNLTQQVSMIRKALGESSGESPYIVTVQGRGYRFAAPVIGHAAAPDPTTDKSIEQEPTASAAVDVPVDHERTGNLVSDTPQTEGRDHFPSRNQITWITAGVIAAGLAVGGYLIERKQFGRGQRPEEPLRLAILPFQSLRRDPSSDFLGFSLADAVIMKLGYVSSVTVRPSSTVEKYRNQPIDLRRIAADLHVDRLLTGNFIHDGDDLRITSQLIDVKAENIIWKGTFDLKYDKLLTVQDSVAQQIIKGLELSLSPLEAQRLKSGKPADPLAYEYYLRGVDLYARNDFAMAIKMLQKSSEIDPKYALTWAHLGRAHTANASFELAGRSEYDAAQAAYEKALALQPSQIEAQIYMANRFTDTGRVESAVPLLRNALRTNPNHAEAHWELGYAYRFAGMLPESVAESERARQLDPGVKLSTSTLNGYLYLGQYDTFLQSLPKDHHSALIVFYRGMGEFYKNNLGQASQYFDQAFEMHPSLLQARVGKALSHSIGNHRRMGLQMLSETEKLISDRGVGDPEAIYKIAQAYSVLADKSSALRVLRLSIDGGFFCYPYVVKDPLLDTLRHEPEFIRLTTAARERHEAFKRVFFLSELSSSKR